MFFFIAITSKLFNVVLVYVVQTECVSPFSSRFDFSNIIKNM
jgi:hypothetical protein